ncbi:AAA family ATPase [Enterococcus faecalis]|uniref:AAA family ATPase n=1 Tax=Enterococcus faecalis TaxID=1351 RepID=UPI0004596034|nr:AAA family ATPase [Enterococcus faecalis]EHH3130689.1 AAA family ATPase [Enterococcus faecalis]EHS2085474.1 AAA family ATPase [Enterococcus faecalis]KAJ61899.1 hypothetical protein P783_0196 [Enterococcus faecalis GA2]HAP2777972.1 AAA family ATPase [Enterococcus faecalis]
MEQFNTGNDKSNVYNLANLWGWTSKQEPQSVVGLLQRYNRLALCGPGKSCKTSAAIQLSVAIAEGKEWLGWQCQQGKVLYINLDNDELNTIGHFKKVYDGLGIPADHLANITIHTLKGEKIISFGAFMDSVIGLAAGEQYMLVVIDPIDYLIDFDKGDPYQLITFDQELNRLVRVLGCSLVYTHSVQREVKGNKEMKKAVSNSRLLRLCDAYIEWIELEPTSNLSWTIRNNELVELYARELLQIDPDYYNENVFDALTETYSWKAADLEPHIKRVLTNEQQEALQVKANQLATRLDHRTAWRTIIVTKNFPPIKDREYWFDYPTHLKSDNQALSDLEPGLSLPLWKKGERSRKPKESKIHERAKKLKAAIEQFKDDNQESPTIDDIAAILGKTPRTVRNWLNEAKNEYVVSSGKIFTLDEMRA